MKFNGRPHVYHLIYTFKEGNHILYPLNGPLVSQFHILVAGILAVGMGVAGLLMTRRDVDVRWFRSLTWASEGRDSSKSLCVVAGLQNLGNNCFLNVILQALASCSCFHSYLQNIIESDDAVVEGRVENLPLTVVLASLLEELCIIRDEKNVISPRRVMQAMELYITGFNLTRQQDAAEAFLHLLSSLKEELSDSYVPDNGSLADISSFPVGRLSSSKRRKGNNEWKQWQQHLFGPFDGTLGSILTCKSCSSQVSMDFEFFHCLPLSPVLDTSASMVDGCTLEDCLWQFTSAEHIDNYSCNRCSHIAALKYLSFNEEGNKMKIEKLRQCSDHDCCICKNLLLQEGIQWPTGFSDAVKKLSIGRCPKILCIQLQRASMNANGEIIKFQGHISFPLVLDFFPFTAAMGVGVEILEKDTQLQVKKQHRLSLVPHLSHFNMQVELLLQMHGIVGKNIPSIYKSRDTCIQTFEREDYIRNADIGKKIQISELHDSQSFSKSEYAGSHPPYDNKLGESTLTLSKNYIYRLVSVVEHYGRPGSGHYAVYRRVKAYSDAEDNVGQFKTAKSHWFYISDNEVSSVSEETVLGAEASLLFYERIEP
ncbi:ubiquitin-specific protease 27 [Tasmannia lanceolata]|uniref:ubiquitin-specific protease 27 n=1 Tax=Tasmannia lanceolata TaxID=3420 RepID=UPI0040628730